MMWFVALALLGGALAVDHRAGWQGLLAHPVFASVLIGALFGEMDAALPAGLLIELVHLSIIPMRGGRPADPVTAGVVGSGTAALLSRYGAVADPALLYAMSVFLGLVAGEAGARITAPFFAVHNRMLSGVEFPAGIERRRLARRLSVIHLGSVAFIFVIEGLTVLLLGAAAFFAGSAVTRIVEGALVRGAAWWSVLVWTIGVASIVHLFWQHRYRGWLAAVAGLVVILLWIA